MLNFRKSNRVEHLLDDCGSEVRRIYDLLTLNLDVPPFLIILLIAFGSLSLYLTSFEFTNVLTFVHNPILDTVYTILDPLLIFAVSGTFAFVKLFQLIAGDAGKVTKKRNRLIWAIVAFVITSGMLTLFENYLLKDTLAILRPEARLGNAVALAILDGTLEKSDSMKSLSFSNPVTRELYELARNSDGSATVKREIWGKLEKKTHGNKEQENDYETLKQRRGFYPREPNASIQLLQFQQLVRWKSKEIYPWFLSLIGQVSDSKYSCPSGFVLRQFLVIFIVLLMVFQSGKSRKNIFKSCYRFYAFTILQIASFFAIVISRIYGYHHTLYDELISIGSSTVILTILLFVFYRAARSTTINLLESIQDLVYKTDCDGKITFANDAFARIMYPQSYNTPRQPRIIGRDITDFWKYPEHRMVLINELEKEPKRVSNYFLWAKSEERRDGFQLAVSSQFIKKRRQDGVWGVGRDLLEEGPGHWGYFQVDTGVNRDNKGAKFIFCDTHFAKILGLEPQDLIGKSVDAIYPDNNLREQVIGQLYTDSEYPDRPSTSLIMLARKNKKRNSRVVVESTKYRIRDGNIDIAIAGTIRDLSSDWERSLIGRYIIQDNVIIYANPSFARVFGYESSMMEGMSISKIIHPEDLEFVLEGLNERQNSPKAPAAEYPFEALRKDGRSIYVFVHSMHCVYAGKGAVMGEMISFDVAARGRVRKMFYDDLIQSVQVVLNHDVMGNLVELEEKIDLVNQGHSGASLNDLLMNVQEMKRTLQLAADALSMEKVFHKTKAGGIALLVSECASKFELVTQGSSVQVDLDSDLLEPRVWIPRKLWWAFSQMMENSHAARENDLRIHISISNKAPSILAKHELEVNDGLPPMLYILYVDNGPGLSDNTICEIMNSDYSSSDDAILEVATPARFGLRMVKYIIEKMHNGKMNVESVLNDADQVEGAKFEIVLPIETGRK